MKPIEIPTSVESEKSILGAIIRDNRVYFDAASDLSTEDFSLDSHKTIYAAIASMMEEGKAVDVSTLCVSLNGRSAAVGGLAYIGSLTDGVVTHRGIVHQHIETLRDRAQRRKAINLCQCAQAELCDTSEDVESAVKALHGNLLSLAAESTKQVPVAVAQANRELVQHLESLCELGKTRDILGLRWGIPSLDRKTTGMRIGEYYLLGGVTKDGKTSAAVQSITSALTDDIPVLFFSHEMTRKSVIMRMVSAATSVPHEKLRDPRKLGMFEWGALKEYLAILDKKPLWIQDAGTMDIASIKAQTRLFVRRHQIKFVIVDFIQKVRGPGKTQYDIITAVSEGLRELAKTENVAVLALSQFSVPQDKKKRRPTLFDFKQSGDLASDAHAALAVYRPLDGEGKFTGQDEFWILAQRSGAGHQMIPVAYNEERLIYEERYV